MPQHQKIRTKNMPMKAKRRWRNWAGSVQAQPNHHSCPANLEEIQSEVLRAAEEGERLRVAGSGRSFSPLCWTDENLMSLRAFHGIESADLERRRAWVRAGTRMGGLGRMLAQHGLALENWQGPEAQTLGGIVNSGAHSTGLGFGCLSAQVTGLRMACADGSVKTFSAESNTALFDAARLSLGALGVITHVELQCVDAYRLRSRSASARLDDTLLRLPEYNAQNRGFSFLWFPYTGSVQLQFLNATSDAATRLKPLQAARQAAIQSAMQWLLAQAARRLPAAAERAHRLTSLRMPATESVVEPHQASHGAQRVPHQEVEFGLPLKKLGAALAQMERVIRALKFPAHLPLEVRFARQDTLWLSPAYQRDTAYVAVRVPLGMPHQDYFAAMTEIADRHDGRPAWGGMHGKTAHDLVQLYPRFNEFLRVRQELDPRGVFLNPHLAGIFGVEQR